MESAISYEDPRIARHLSPAETTGLLEHHPNGQARFWGAKPLFDAQMDQLRAGDLVLFTGESRLRAIGVIGFLTRNENLANELWAPTEGERGWTNVYSISHLIPVSGVDYRQLASSVGYAPNSNFQSTALLTPDKAERAITGLNINVEMFGVPLEPEQFETDAEALVALTSGPGQIPLERMHVTDSAYDLPERTIAFRRIEALLVRAYVSSLPPGPVTRLKTGAGLTDIYVPATHELIEAKRGSDIRFVREALAQLLDYSTHTHDEIARMSLSFPAAPASVAWAC